MRKALAALSGIAFLVGTSWAGAAQIEGDYIEARTADVYTGPCFSNAEVFITGHQAVMAWGVRKGTWDGVDLSGLKVAAAVRGSTTLSADDPAAARSVLIVDHNANAAQRAALIAMAKHLAGGRLERIESVQTTRITLMVESHEAAQASAAAHVLHPGAPQAPKASLWAAGLAEILTRPLDDTDHFCGNETVAYPPLSKGVTAVPAYTLGHRFRGTGLNTNWNDPHCRSSFVGQFAY